MVRNKAAHSVSGHKAKSEYRRHKFNELDHENLPSFGGLESYRSATKMRRSCSEECPDFMHCVETSAIQLHKQNPPSERGTDVSREDGPIKLCAQMRSSSSADAEAQAAAAINLRILSKVAMFLIAEGS